MCAPPRRMAGRLLVPEPVLGETCNFLRNNVPRGAAAEIRFLHAMLDERGDFDIIDPVPEDRRRAVELADRLATAPVGLRRRDGHRHRRAPAGAPHRHDRLQDGRDDEPGVPVAATALGTPGKLNGAHSTCSCPGEQFFRSRGRGGHYVAAVSVTADVRFTVPLYTCTEAAGYLGVPPTTFTTWLKGYRREFPNRPPAPVTRW